METEGKKILISADKGSSVGTSNFLSSALRRASTRSEVGGLHLAPVMQTATG
jgi:hypothetical protein